MPTPPTDTAHLTRRSTRMHSTQSMESAASSGFKSVIYWEA